MKQDISNSIEINIEELKNNQDYYIDLAERKEISVIKNGKIVFTLIPERKKLVKEFEKFFGMLPENATIGIDPNERDQ